MTTASFQRRLRTLRTDQLNWTEILFCPHRLVSLINRLMVQKISENLECSAQLFFQVVPTRLIQPFSIIPSTERTITGLKKWSSQKLPKKEDYVGLYLFDTNKFFFRMEKEGLVVGIEADGGLVGFWGPKGTWPGGAMVVWYFWILVRRDVVDNITENF